MEYGRIWKAKYSQNCVSRSFWIHNPDGYSSILILTKAKVKIGIKKKDYWSSRGFDTTQGCSTYHVEK